MNLIDSPWLPFRGRDGSTFYGAPSTIADPEVVDFALPRADFQGAAWQFLIGLVQTTCAPAAVEDWQDGWVTAPTAASLEASFSVYRSAFELSGDGPVFMQDHDPLADARAAPVSSLLIEAPGAQGIKFNTDHFVKRGLGEVMCPACAAIALYTMQINAPSGGKGYRTGLRGGGPLTTLVLPQQDDASLWHKLWLNVLPRAAFSYPTPQADDWRVFPWLAATRVSDSPGSETLPEDVHPLHVYWAMPRRFRLEIQDETGSCEICGSATQRSVRQVRTRNYGYNYDGAWRHPLTPYRFDPKKPDQPPLSIKGQQGGLGYRHWESLVLEDRDDKGYLPALAVLDYPRTKLEALEDLGATTRFARLWAFGYDMDNMKARGWYATQMPLVAVSGAQRRTRLLSWNQYLMRAAEKTAWQLRSAVKSAWFSRPGDAKGDVSFVDQRFWEATEADFYACLRDLAAALETGVDQLPQAVAEHWLRVLRSTATSVFDDLALAGDAEALDMKRITAARNRLQRWLGGGKEMKALRRLAQEEAA